MGKAAAPVFVTELEEKELQLLREFVNSDAGKEFQSAHGGEIIGPAVRLADRLVNLMGLGEKVPGLSRALVWKPEDLPPGVDPALFLVINRFEPVMRQALNGLSSYKFSMAALKQVFRLVEQQESAEKTGRNLRTWVKKLTGNAAAPAPEALDRMPFTTQLMALCYFYSYVMTNRIWSEPQCLLFIVSGSLFRNFNEYLRLSLVRQNVLTREISRSKKAEPDFVIGTKEEMDGLALCLNYYDAVVKEARAGGIRNPADTTARTIAFRGDRLMARSFPKKEA